MSGLTSDYDNIKLSGNFTLDKAKFKEIFKNDGILRERYIKTDENRSAVLFYMDGMVNSELINEAIVRPLILSKIPSTVKFDADYIASNILFAGEVNTTNDMADLIRSVLYGDTVIFIEGCTSALTVNTKGFRSRGISEPADERVLQGPREGFDEVALLNIAMLRRKLLTPDLCVEMLRIGRRTETVVFVCYLGSLADKSTVDELKRRMNMIDIDGILDSNYIAEHIRDHKNSLFKTTGTTERPDIVAARLLEGRIAVVVDGTPVVLTLPYLFSENFQSDEDYYLNYMVSSVGRVLRYICFFIAVSAPAIFVALTTFHMQLLPTNFALSISQLRGGVPMPSVVESIILILVFEILKETGVRMPQSLGHALSIVGGLVVGQAAVEARIISAPTLIAVALSGIAGLMIPRLKGIVFYLRLLLVIASSVFGLFGYIAVSAVFVIRIFSITSFGVDYTVSLNNPNSQNLKDTVWRASWTFMKKRPVFNRNIIRSGDVRKRQ